MTNASLRVTLRVWTHLILVSSKSVPRAACSMRGMDVPVLATGERDPATWFSTCGALGESQPAHLDTSLSSIEMSLMTLLIPDAGLSILSISPVAVITSSCPPIDGMVIVDTPLVGASGMESMVSRTYRRS